MWKISLRCISSTDFPHMVKFGSPVPEIWNQKVTWLQLKSLDLLTSFLLSAEKSWSTSTTETIFIWLLGQWGNVVEKELSRRQSLLRKLMSQLINCLSELSDQLFKHLKTVLDFILQTSTFQDSSKETTDRTDQEQHQFSVLRYGTNRRSRIWEEIKHRS